LPSSVVTRFAPSPTGMLHIGGVRTALFAWLFAKKYSGKFILRVEDTDTDRSTEDNIRIIEEGMLWSGLIWDEGPDPKHSGAWLGDHGPYRQILRMDLYKLKITELLDQGKAYRCRCTKESLEDRRKESDRAGKPFQYNRGLDLGRGCRDQHYDDSSPSSIRFAMPLGGDILLQDAIKGTIRFPSESLDDWIIARWSEPGEIGIPTYNFSVVVDDVAMKVSHVIRGDDHVANTPKQIPLFEALGYALPVFAHVPMILGKDKQKLSKRHGAASITEFKDLGFLPQAVRLTLAKLSWTPKIDGRVAESAEEEILTDAQLIESFNLEDIQTSPSVFDIDKLYWINQKLIMNSTNEFLIQALNPFMPPPWLIRDRAWKELAVSCTKERSRTLKEMAESLSFCWQAPQVFDEKLLSKHLSESHRLALRSVSAFRDWTAEGLREGLDQVLLEHQIKLKDLAQALRVALTGGTISPPIHETLLLLGAEEIKRRLLRWI